MKMRQEQLKLQILLKETITLLCKNGLEFNNGFVVNALIGITTDDSETFLVKLEEKVGDVTGDGDVVDRASNRTADGRGRRSRALRKRRTGRNDDVTPTKRQRADSDDDSADDICDDNDNDPDLENVPSKPLDADIITVKHEPSDDDGQYAQINQIQTPPVGANQHAQNDQTQVDVAQSDDGHQHIKDSVDGGSHDGSSSTWNQSSTNNDTNAAGSQQVRAYFFHNM